MRRSRFIHNRPSSSPSRPASTSKWVWALFVLIIFSLLVTGCSARTLSFDEFLSIFLVQEPIGPVAGAGDSQTQDQDGPTSNSSSSSSGLPHDGGEEYTPTFTPTPELDPEEPTATPLPGGDGSQATATATPTIPGAASPTPTMTPIFAPTSTPTELIPGATPTTAPPTATPTTAPPTATPTTAPPTATETTCSVSGSSAYENALVALINQERGNQGIAAMTASSQLTAAARVYSTDMACNGVWYHIGSDDSTPSVRIQRSGFNATATAENIAAGMIAQQTFNAWMNSDGHRINMLNPTYTHIGVGYTYRAGSPYGHYFTADFARP